MAEAVIAGGSGGTGSDECTATKDHLLAGYKAVTRDSDDEAVEGTMPDQGAVSQTLNCGGSYTIPAGYHNGSGKVSAATLASQTGGATADVSRVLSGYTFWRDGQLLTGNMTIQSIVSFSAALYSTRALLLAWGNPARGPYSGVDIWYRTDGRYPAYAGDGIYCYGGNGTYTVVSNLPANSGVWFAAYSYAIVNGAKLYQNISSLAYGFASVIQGQQVYTSSAVFTVPANVYIIDVFVVGGGGYGYSTDGSGGGAGGYTNTVKGVAVSPGQVYGITIGAGAATGRSAGSSSFGGISAGGGGNGKNSGQGGGGGSGGGGGNAASNNTWRAGNGGADGAAGAPAANQSNGGAGQGRTTRAFSEGWNTLYAGGGGGAGAGSYVNSRAGEGGAGGGGRGGSPAGSGASGTGGGGGAGGGSGGSGVVIVRWGY